jgi:general secretion pathway protein J
MKSIDQNGFTLLEILIASSMFAVLLSLLFGSYSASLGVMGKARADSEIYNMARVALDRIGEDLESCFLQPSPVGEEVPFSRVFGAFQGTERRVGEYEGDFLRFLSRADVVLDGSGGAAVESEIVYDAREQETGGKLALFRVDIPFGTEAPDEGTGGHILCEDLIGVNFRYHRVDEDLERWDSTDGDTSGRIPDRVTVRLVFEDPATPETALIFTTGIAIPSARQRNGTAVP